MGDTPAVTTGIFDSITSDMLMGVVDELVQLIPIILPVVITFIAFRKGLALIKRSASGR